MKKSIFNRFSILLTTSVLIMAQVILPVHSAFADQPPKLDPSKAAVCKYVGKPGTDERLQTGNNPIVVDRKADMVIGTPFVDAQGRSIVIAFLNPGDKEPDVSACPAPAPDQITSPTISLEGVCGINNDKVTLSTSSDYSASTPVWSNSKVSVTFTITPGVNKLFSNGATSITITKDEVNVNTDCVALPETINNPSITLTGKCGINNDTVSMPESDDYTASTPVWTDSVVSVTFTIKANVNKVFQSTGTKKVTVTANEENTADCPREAQPCTVHDTTFTKEWAYGGATMPEAGADSENESALPGTYEFVNNAFFSGIHLTTPAVESYVDGLIDAGNTNIQDVDRMSYTTYRSSSSTGYNGTLPAYVLQIDKDGNPATTNDTSYLFYEPYNNGTVVAGTWQNWDAINGGNAKWWMSGTGQALQTWDYFKATFPHATVNGYGFNQGTYNAGADTYIKSMTFDCATTTFSAPGKGGVEPTPIPTPAPTPTPTPIPTTPEAPVIPSAPSTPVVSAGKGAVMPTELPETGASFNMLLVGTLAAAVAYGALYFAQPKRFYE